MKGNRVQMGSAQKCLNLIKGEQVLSILSTISNVNKCKQTITQQMDQKCSTTFCWMPYSLIKTQTSAYHRHWSWLSERKQSQTRWRRRTGTGRPCCPARSAGADVRCSAWCLHHYWQSSPSLCQAAPGTISQKWWLVWCVVKLQGVIVANNGLLYW